MTSTRPVPRAGSAPIPELIFGDLWKYDPAPETAWQIEPAAVLVGTGFADLHGLLPGVEPRPYIIRFTEDRPNPIYRRVCYTTAWGEVIAFAVAKPFANIFEAIRMGPPDADRFLSKGEHLPVLRMNGVFGLNPVDLVGQEVFGQGGVGIDVDGGEDGGHGGSGGLDF